MFRAVLLSILISSTSQLFAQVKWEREYRIHPSSVPEKAILFIDSAKLESRVKWYAEESHEGKTFESKFQFSKKKHSVEFSESGDVLDIEVELKLSELPESWVMAFDEALAEHFTRVKIVKVQAQYSDELMDYMHSKNATLSKVNYEVVIRGYKGRDFRFYEATLDSMLSLISLKEIVTRNTDNLEF